MDNRLTILVCKHFEGEGKAISQMSEFREVDFVSFSARCGRPPLCWQELEELIPDPDNRSRIELVGGCCLSTLMKAPDIKKRFRQRKMDQCFYCVAGRELVDHYLQTGAYLITPGWLAHWRDKIDQLGFDQEGAREFFRTSVTRLLLLDTGVNSRSLESLRELAQYLDRPFERLPVGLDYFRSFLLEFDHGWREEESERARVQTCKQTSELSMALDLLSRLPRLSTESEVIKTILDLFNMLFAPKKSCYLPILDGEPGKMHTGAAMGIDSTRSRERMVNLHTAYEWCESGDGFRLSVRREKETIGVIEVDEFEFPQHKEHYLNLALSMTGVCLLAVQNARTFESLQQTQAMLEQRNRTLDGLVEELKVALKQVKQLGGLLPICSSCKKIRDDQGYWNQIEAYIGDHSEVEFTHGICPDCAARLYSEFLEDP